MELSFQLADPAGNITLLVTTPVPREDHPALAAGLLSIPELHAEQVGFLVPPQGAGVIRLEMMGGEFCGNALRCAGLYYAVQQGRRRAGRFPVEVSGYDKALSVQVNPLANQVSAEMPLPQAVQSCTLFGAAAQAVLLPGIVHAVSSLPPEQPEAAVREALEGLARDYAVPAAGVMFWDRQRSTLTPAVYVQGTSSLYFERSCASGSTAVAACHALSSQRDGSFKLALKQPGGTIHTTATLRGGKLQQLTIGGVVSLGQAYTLEF